MRGIWREIVKHLRVYLILARLNAMSQLAYRTNFVTGILMELAFLMTKLLYALVAFRAGRTVAGLTPDEMLVFVGAFITATGFYAGLFMMNIFQLSGRLDDGSFDILLTKPVSLQLLATLWRCDLGMFLVDVVGGAIVTAIGLARLPGAFQLWRIFGYVFLLACGTAAAYAIYLLPQSLVFTLGRRGGLANLSASLWEVNNLPMTAYGRVGRLLGTYLLPLFVVTSFPSLFVLGRITGAQLIWGVVAPIGFLVVSRLAWQAGVKSYTRGDGA
jgi:ABC-2 type transport system permease protein